jgi:hypothetical protein
LMKNVPGMTPAGAAGAVARMSSIEAPGGPTSANDIGGGHYGIGQWSRARAGDVWGNPDFDAQLALYAKEVREGEGGGASRRSFLSAKTAAEGSRAASQFERAGGYNPLTGTDAFTGRTPTKKLMEQLGIPESRNDAVELQKVAWAGSSINRSKNINNQSSTEMNIGEVNVHTAATDADNIARDIGPALRRNTLAVPSNYGLS